ncbi:MAG: spore coat associated protein CotJA [Clostridia bacterium]|nr:spore coat associated protein CotJA [Clostridia bacterium]
MRLESSSRNQRKDFDEFTRFLGIGSQRQQRVEAQSAPSVSTQPKESLAMVYAPKQEYRMIYDPEVALINGTIFEELNKPFNRASCRGKSSGTEGCL